MSPPANPTLGFSPLDVLPLSHLVRELHRVPEFAVNVCAFVYPDVMNVESVVQIIDIPTIGNRPLAFSSSLS